MKIKEVLKKIFFSLGLFLSGILTVLFFTKRKENEKELQDEKESNYNKIKNTSAAELVSNSSNQQDILRTKTESKNNLRERIQNRIKETEL